MYSQSAKQLANNATKHSKDFGAELCQDVERAANLLLNWLGYLDPTFLNGTADELIRGSRKAIIEVAGCLSLGLVRPAVFSLRAQIDMSLSWLFFKDHLVEWNRVLSEGEGFKLKKEVCHYLELHYPEFKRRFALLADRKKRKEKEPYHLLSAHIHSQSVYTVPRLSSLETMVEDITICRECVMLQYEVSEYISDVLLSCSIYEWHDLPTDVTKNVKTRLAPHELKKFLLRS
ncbi:hypothetical protein ES703_90719 [subsurface metagenome]